MDHHRGGSRWNGGSMLRGFTGLVVLASGGGALGPTVGGPAAASAQQSAAAVPLVFDGVTVIGVEKGEPILAQRVVVVGNRIQTVGSVNTVSIPRGARVVDARGKYLIPGLWDMHAHPQHSVDIFYPLFIANGVTGIRDAGSDVPLDTLILWRREILAGRRIGPTRLLVSGPYISSCTSGHQSFEACASAPVDSTLDSLQIAEARRLVDSLKMAGADAIKARDVSRATYFVLAAEARRLGIPFGGHAQAEMAIEASDSGASIVDHMQYLMGPRGLSALCWGNQASIEQCQPIAERFRRNGTWLVPTLFSYGGGGPTSHSYPVVARIVARIVEFWAGTVLNSFAADRIDDLADSETSPPSPDSATDSLGNMHIMQRVNLPLLAGTDVWPDGSARRAAGFALHAELAIYVAEGLTPLAALQAATFNPAKYLHGTDSLDTVAPGKLADLVLLDADPLVDIANTTKIRAVVANGRYFDRTALDRLLGDVQHLVSP